MNGSYLRSVAGEWYFQTPLPAPTRCCLQPASLAPMRRRPPSALDRLANPARQRSMAPASLLSRAPQRAQLSISMPNTRSRRCAQRIATWRLDSPEWVSLDTHSGAWGG